MSIVLPCRNVVTDVQEAIDSFLAQDHADKELVIVDAASTDGTHDIIRRAAELSRDVVWVQEADSGISDAFAKGFRASTGQVIGFLGADDLLVPGALSAVAELFQVMDLDGVFTDSYVWWVPERRCLLRKPLAADMSRTSLLRHGPVVAWQNLFLSRRRYEEHLPDPLLRAAMDLELYLRMAADEPLYAYLDRATTVNRYGSGGAGGANISRDLDGSQARELRRIADAYADGATPSFCA